MPKACRFNQCDCAFDSVVDLHSHESRCKFATSRCPACQTEGPRKDIFVHVEQCVAIWPIPLPLTICRYQTDVLISELPAKSPTHFKGCYRLQPEGEWSGRFLLAITIQKSELDEFGPYDKMVVEVFAFFPEDSPPRDDFPIKIAIRNKTTKQFIMFCPTPKHNRQILRSTEIQGLLGTKDFSNLILKPQVRQYDLDEFLKAK